MQTRARITRALPRAPRLWPDQRRRRAVLAFVLCAIAAALVAVPVTLERAIESVRFRDDLGTFPVEVSLCHDGRSTLDTGILGKVFWGRTGAFGFGAYARAIGPPEAGGTLASYVDPRFFQANVAFIHDPDVVVRAYSEEIREALWHKVVREELWVALLGGSLLFVVIPRHRLRDVPRLHVSLASVLLVGLAAATTTLAAAKLFDAWPCSTAPAVTYSVPGMKDPTFSSPQMSEIVSQVQPFITKNTQRIKQAADQYERASAASLGTVLQGRGSALAPRTGETIVAAEADPQGSFVGAAVRKTLYSGLTRLLGPDAISLRTISGDVTSNGTVAESSYVRTEARVDKRIPVVAVGGDHDSEKTWPQLKGAGMTVPDLTTVDAGSLKVSGADDREHKTLFGGMITNREGVSEQQLGAKLRDKVDPGSGIVLLHQPDAVAGFLGLDTLDPVRALAQTGSALTTPYDDGIPDQPPGIINVGHLHQPAGPWVLWNTDGPTVTWTVVDQLGTAGGAENTPTFSRFSTPMSPPLKPVMVRLEYVDVKSGLETGYVTVECGLDGTWTFSDRVDVGLPGGQPGRLPSRLLGRLLGRATGPGAPTSASASPR